MNGNRAFQSVGSPIFLLYRKVLTFRNHDMRNARTEAGMVSDEGDQKR
jgi:hypothetical protein